MTYQFLNEYTFANGIKLKNSVVMAPMTTMSGFYNGEVTTDELDYFRHRAGGPGMIITGCAYVIDSGKGFEGEFSAASDEMIPSLTKLANAVQKDGTKAILQIFHAGRQSNSKILRGTQSVSASAVTALYPANAETPRALTEPEILEIIDAFGQAIKRAILAGFDGVELHGANTYLLQQFFSLHSNRRDDEWGGSRDKRMNFALKIIAKSKEIIKQYTTKPFILGYRFSPEEIEEPGIRLEDSLYFIEKIKNKVDYIHISLNDYKQTSRNDKSNQQTIISQVAKQLDNAVPLIAVGSVFTPADAESVLADGADLVALGRELLREPQWVQKAARGDINGIRTKISSTDQDELNLPAGLQTMLNTIFKSSMRFTDDIEEK